MSGLRNPPPRGFRAGVRAVAALAVAASASTPAGATDTYRTGTFVITGRATLSANVPAKDELTAYISIGETTATKVVIQGVSFPAKVTRAGSVATFSARVPYKWVIDSATLSQIVVNVGASLGGSLVSASTGMVVPLPASGATTSVSFKLAM